MSVGRGPAYSWCHEVGLSSGRLSSICSREVGKNNLKHYCLGERV